MPSPALTITGTFAAITGTSTGTVTFTLVNYGNNIPTVGSVVIPTVITSQTGATFSVNLFGNDVIAPNTTYYVVSFYGSDGTHTIDVAYSITGSGTVDITTLSPINPSLPPYNPSAGLANPTFANTTTTNLTVSGSSLLTDVNLKSVNGTEYADQYTGTFSQKIAAAYAALPASGGIVDATGFGATVQTIGASEQLIIGAASKPMYLKLSPYTQIIVNYNGGGTAIPIANGSMLDGGVSAFFANTATVKGYIKASATSNMTALVGPADITGSQQTFAVKDVTLQSSAGAVVGTLLNVQGVFIGCVFENISTYALNGAIGLTVQPGTVQGLCSDILFVNCNFADGLNAAGSLPVYIYGRDNNSGVSNITFIGGAIQDQGNNQPVLKIDGGPSGAQTMGIRFYNVDFETSPSSADLITIANAHDVLLDGIVISGTRGTSVNVVKLSEAGVGFTYNITLKDISVPTASGYTNLVNNTINGDAITGVSTGWGRTQLSKYEYNRFSNAKYYGSWIDKQTVSSLVGVGDAAYTSPYTAIGSIHLLPTSGTNGNAAAITFAANAGTGVNNTANAGIKVQSSNSFGTRMFFATTSVFGTATDQWEISETGNLIGLHAGASIAVPVVNATTGFQVNGTALASANLSDSSNVAKRNAANAFTNANTFTGTNTFTGAAATSDYLVMTPGDTQGTVVFNTTAQGLRIGTLSSGVQFLSMGVNKTAADSTYRAMTNNNALINHTIQEFGYTGETRFLYQAHQADGTALTPSVVLDLNPASSTAAFGAGIAVTISGGLTLGSSGVVIPGATSGASTLAASAAASGTLTLPAATDTLVAKATTDTLTNKTYDTAGTGNVFKVSGTTITGAQGNGAKIQLSTGTVTSNTVAKFDASGNTVNSAITDDGTTAKLGTKFGVTESTGAVSTVANLATVGTFGTPIAVYSTSDQTGNSTATVTTTMLTTAPVGDYVFYASFYMQTAGTAGTYQINCVSNPGSFFNGGAGVTDAVGASINATAATARTVTSIAFHHGDATKNIQWQIQATGVTGTPAYHYTFTLVRLN